MSKTVRVRIAVAVDKNGDWNAHGWGTANGVEDEGVSVSEVLDGLPEEGSDCRHVRFVEAEVPVPESATIQGEVQP